VEQLENALVAFGVSHRFMTLADQVVRSATARVDYVEVPHVLLHFNREHWHFDIVAFQFALFELRGNQAPI